MANEELVKLLREGGAEAAAKWREEPADVEMDLQGADLSGANLSGANLTHANLIGADQYRTSLQCRKVRTVSVLRGSPDPLPRIFRQSPIDSHYHL